MMADVSRIVLHKSLLGDEVFRRLGEAILSGDLSEGERLRDADLAEMLGVSRTPVREALQRLERIGMVEMVPGRHTVVTEVTDDMVRQSREIVGYQAGVAMHMGVPRLTGDEREVVTELVDGVIDAGDDRAASAAAQRQLYHYIGSTTGNSLHHAHMRELELALERNLGARVPDCTMPENFVQEVKNLRAAVVAGDGGAAERAVRRMHGVP